MLDTHNYVFVDNSRKCHEKCKTNCPKTNCGRCCKEKNCCSLQKDCCSKNDCCTKEQNECCIRTDCCVRSEKCCHENECCDKGIIFSYFTYNLDCDHFSFLEVDPTCRRKCCNTQECCENKTVQQKCC